MTNFKKDKGLRVFIVSCVFPPEPQTSALTSSDLAEEMVRRGHEVTVFAPFPNRQLSHLTSSYARRWKQVEHKDGYRIVRTWHTLSKKSTFVSRVAENISFGLTSSWQIFREKPPDVVYMNTWPLFSQNMNSWLLKRLRVPIICSVQDIFPEVLSGKDMIKPNGWLFRIIRNYNSRHLHRCDMVISLSQSMVDLLIKDRGLSPKKVHLIPNWMDASKFPPGLPRDGVFRKKLGINAEVFLAVYAGSLTMAAGPDLYVQTAGKLSGRTDIRILLVGDGSMRERLEKDIASRGLDNIQVVHPLITEELPEIQAAADVLLLSLTGQMLQSLAPSKQIAYMFSGRPVMASISKENVAAKILLEAEAGFVLSPDDPQAVADLLARLAQDRSSLQRLGDNARRFAEENFSKQIVLPRLVSLLESAVKINN